MKPFLKAVVILSRSLGRIAIALEGILELYRADCSSRGVQIYHPSENKLEDSVEISYGAKIPSSPMENWRNK